MEENNLRNVLKLMSLCHSVSVSFSCLMAYMIAQAGAASVGHEVEGCVESGRAQKW